nr:ribonuclease H [Tanacetum cinerariifolium]
MRVASINGKKYILVIVDDYSRDGENLDKIEEKGDPCILVGYSTQSKGYCVYNKKTRMIVESIHILFDEFKEVTETSVANDTFGLVPQRQKALDYDNPDLGSNPQDKQTTMNIQPTSEPSTPTYVHAEENNDNQAEGEQSPYDEFTNPFYTPVRELVDKPFGKTVIKLKWLWKNKKVEDQTVIRNKARLVAKGKALYGLKQAPRAWYDELSKFLTSKGFTKEAEYMALSASYAQVMWMRAQLQDYGFNYNKIPLYCDSQSAIAISCNLVHHSRTKHIHTRYYFKKEQVENGLIELYFVRTEYQLGDMFTKALLEDRFKYLVRRIGMRCLTLAELEVLANKST